ncbi:hypothetical protein GF325_06020 [Candidatus Bathyarchaeota archaeon]|nr:hypothetical protein [Candidatus Bathyarchaeota archaeon]
MFGGGSFGDLPFDISEVFKQFKENIEIIKDDEGIIIKYKEIVPGLNLEMLKGMLEKAIGSGKLDMVNDMLFGGQDGMEGNVIEDDPEDDLEDQTEFDIIVLEDEQGLKLIPHDPADLDDMHETITQMFNPEFFEQAIKSVFQFIQEQLGNMLGGHDDELAQGKNDDAEDEFEDQGDSNTTGDYFYS